MAIVISPANSFRASGNMGAINYTSIRGVAIARARCSPVQPNTPAQVIIQGYLRTIVAAWKTVLTATQLESWRQAARTIKFRNRLGQPFQPSGYALYTKLNMNLLIADGSINEEYPGGALASKSFTMTPQDYGPGVLLIVWILLPDFMDVWKMQLWIAGPYEGQARQPQKNDYKIIQTQSGFAPHHYWHIIGLESGKTYHFQGRVIDKKGYAGNFHHVSHIIE